MRLILAADDSGPDPSPSGSNEPSGPDDQPEPKNSEPSDNEPRGNEPGGNEPPSGTLTFRFDSDRVNNSNEVDGVTPVTPGDRSGLDRPTPVDHPYVVDPLPKEGGAGES